MSPVYIYKKTGDNFMKYIISGKMCLLSIITCATFFSFSIQKKPSSERAENAKFVLANLAQMIGQIGFIVEEPHNPHNVENAVTHIVNNIVKITMHAVQNKTLKKREAHNIICIVHAMCRDFECYESVNASLRLFK